MVTKYFTFNIKNTDDINKFILMINTFIQDTNSIDNKVSMSFKTNNIYLGKDVDISNDAITRDVISGMIINNEIKSISLGIRIYHSS